MRKLNKKQKVILDNFFETIKDEHGLAVRDIAFELLPLNVYEELERINDFETIHSHINNYLHSKV